MIHFQAQRTISQQQSPSQSQDLIKIQLSPLEFDILFEIPDTEKEL